MLKTTRLCLLAGLAILLAACAQAQVEAPPAPTPNLPPTETPTPAPTVTPFVRPTLPPTWTPTGEATEPVSTPTQNAAFAAILTQPPLPEVCDGFAPDMSRTPTSVNIGDSVQVYWTPALDAAYYEAELYDSQNARVFVRRTEDLTATFPADSFAGDRQLYGWTVIPYSADGVPICLPRGSEIRTHMP